MKEKSKRRIRNTVAIVKFMLMITIIVGIPAALFLKNPEFIDNFRSLESINALLDRYKMGTFMFFVIAQIVQVVVSIIPGQAIQIAAGYSYIFWLACIITFVGIGIGTFITFYIAKLLGSDAMHLIFGEEKFKKYVETLNSKRAFIAIFIIFLIPGIPKDIFTYAAGLSEMKALNFTLLTMCARAPALMASILFGGMIRSGSYVGMIIMAASMLILCVLGLIYHSRITDWVDKAYNKLSKNTK
ncbi:MAG: VTT domain-containing protein [Clostridiales Family XIII bacterium]|jgi:uncharacterized membrane protein YdjX (TVP38/TMEM64 family)|nr:VTT domain-containing protein [Clostridiales Family XIII bacterium]